MRLQPPRQFFTAWVGWGVPPFFFGSVLVAWRGGPWLIALHVGVLVAWMLETAMTTCRRCAFYGTSHCGLPGRVVPLVFKRQPANSISVRRVRAHQWVDVAMMAYMNALYVALCPRLAPLVAVGSAVTLVFVYRAKRFHGLLYRLRTPAAARTKTIHLRVIKPTRPSVTCGSTPAAA